MSKKILNKKNILLVILATLLLVCLLVVTTNIKNSKASFDNVQIKENYMLNEVLAVPEVDFTLDGNSYDTTAILYFPSGNVVSAESVKLSEVGRYQLVYRSIVNDKVYESSYSFVVEKSLYEMNVDRASAVYGSHEYIPNKEGVIIELVNGSTFTYNRVLDLSKLTKNDSLIEYYILPKNIGTADLSQIKVKLTDIYDPDNYVVITAIDSYWAPRTSVAAANASGQIIAGCEKAPYSAAYPMLLWEGEWYRIQRNTGGGAYMNALCAFGGRPASGSIETNCLKLSYDYASKQIFGNDCFISDLDNITIYSKPWAGFKTGEVYLTIEGAQFISSSASIMVTKLMDENLSKNVYVDDNAPEIDCELNGYTVENLPYGIVGQNYNLFNASASDKEDSAVEVDVKVYYNYNTQFQTETRIYDGKYFKPESVGRYTIVYSATDASGNSAKKLELPVQVFSEKKTEITLTNTSNNQGVVGQVFNVSDYDVDGASGKSNVKIYARHASSGKVTEIDSDELTFVPLDFGGYSVVYECSDYVGTVTKEYTISVSGSEKPYIDCSSVKLPRYLITNVKYLFDSAKAYNFVSGNAVSAPVYIMLYSDGSAQGTLYNNTDQITITAKNKIVLRYFVVNDKYIQNPAQVDFASPYVAYKDYEIVVFDTGFTVGGNLNIDKYFYTNGSLSSNKTGSGINYTTTQKAIDDGFAQVEYIGNIYINASAYELSFENTSSFPSFSINYFEEQTGEKLYKITYEQIESMLLITINDRYSYTTDLSNLNFAFSVDAENMALNLYNGITVGMEETINGKDASYMLGKKLYSSITFENVTKEFSFKLKKFCNQYLNLSGYDQYQPVITDLDIPSSYPLNDVYTLPSEIYTYDIVNPTLTFELKVLGPDGKIAKDVNGRSLSGVNPNEKISILFDQSGTYRLIYTSEDGATNPSEVRYPINVVDVVKPSITVDEDRTVEYEVGDSIKIANYSAYDEQTDDLDVKVYCVMPDNRAIDVSSGSIKAEKAGTYYINYFVLDNAGNATFVSYKVVVR